MKSVENIRWAKKINKLNILRCLKDAQPISHVYSLWATISHDKSIVNTLNMVEEIRGHAVVFVFGYVGVQIEYNDYLIYVQGGKSNRTVPSG